jgi:hypothetical protein
MIGFRYPDPAFRIKSEGGKDYIFDSFRKKWLVLTPEEWVRQNFLQYLVQVMKYPLSLIAVEKEFRFGEMNRRFDILIYNTHHQPWMMVECKAPEIVLDQSVMEQVLRYNISIPVPYLVITNGATGYAWLKKGQGLTELQDLPAFGV